MTTGNGSEISYKEAYEQERERKNSLNNAVIGLQKQLLEAQKQNKLLADVNFSGEKQMFNQKNINHNVMTQNNEKVQELSTEIERLRGMVRDLGGNPN
jgi:hypothetical protein